MANNKVQLTTDTPMRLRPEVCAAFIKSRRALIEANGANFALNELLAEVLRKEGHKIPPLETPLERIANAQKRRWKSVKQAQKAEEKETIARKQRKAATDKARRLRLKEKTETDTDTTPGE